MAESKQYLDVLKYYMKRAFMTQKENIINAAKIMGDCMVSGGIIQLVGVNHGREFAMELGYRAGGLMPFHQFNIRDLALRGHISEEILKNPQIINDESMAKRWLDIYNICENDMFLIVSEGGFEPILVEIALTAKRDNRKIIVVVSKNRANNSEAKHSSGTKLIDYADVVIDLGTEEKDILIDINGTMINQASTIVGNVIAQMLTAEIYRYLKENNHDCPILLSANIKGADIHNRKLSDKYIGRWNS